MAEAQSRRLEEQRATFHVPQGPPKLARAPPRPQEDKEQLYSTILSHQVRHPPARRPDPDFLVSRPCALWGPIPPAPALAPHPSQVSCVPCIPALPGLPSFLTTTLPSSIPPVPADGSPAVRAPPPPRGAGAPGVAAQSSGWGSNGGTKVPAPRSHLLRLEPPPARPPHSGGPGTGPSGHLTVPRPGPCACELRGEGLAPGNGQGRRVLEDPEPELEAVSTPRPGHPSSQGAAAGTPRRQAARQDPRPPPPKKTPRAPGCDPGQARPPGQRGGDGLRAPPAPALKFGL